MTTQVKIMNEYMVGWPLWDASGPAGRREFALSEILAQRLKQWARFFNDHFDRETGWDDPALTEPHRIEAHELYRLVSDDLGPDYGVRLDLWEV